METCRLHRHRFKAPTELNKQTDNAKSMVEQAGNLTMESSRVLVLFACVLLSAHRVANAAGPTGHYSMIASCGVSYRNASRARKELVGRDAL